MNIWVLSGGWWVFDPSALRGVFRKPYNISKFNDFGADGFCVEMRPFSMMGVLMKRQQLVRDTTFGISIFKDGSGQFDQIVVGFHG